MKIKIKIVKNIRNDYAFHLKVKHKGSSFVELFLVIGFNTNLILMDAQISAYKIESYYVSSFVQIEKWFVWDFTKVRLFKMNFKKNSINSGYGSFHPNFDWVVISASTSQMLRMGIVKSVIAKLKIAEIHEIRKNGGYDRS